MGDFFLINSLNNSIMHYGLINALFDDSSSSSDEDLDSLSALVFLEQNRQNNEELPHHLKCVSDEQFLDDYRINVKTFQKLHKDFANSEHFQLLEVSDKSLSAAEMLTIFLYFSGHKHSFNWTQSAKFSAVAPQDLYNIIDGVSTFIKHMYSDYIKWPNSAEALQSKTYYSTKGFPNVIGCLGHLTISVLSDKKICKFVLQAVCNEQQRFIDFNVGGEGVIEPVRVFKSSSLYNKAHEFSEGGHFLVTIDSNLQRSFLLSPYLRIDGLKAKEKKFNDMLSDCYEDIEETFESLKRRFRQLNKVQLNNSASIMNFISACCILHNLCDPEDLESLETEEEEGFNKK